MAPRIEPNSGRINNRCLDPTCGHVETGWSFSNKYAWILEAGTHNIVTQNANHGIWGAPEIRADEVAISIRSKVGEVSP